VIGLPPQTCDVSQVSVSSQVQSYPPVAEQVEDADAGLQVQETKSHKQTYSVISLVIVHIVVYIPGLKLP